MAAADIGELNRAFAIPGRLAVEESPLGGAVIVLATGASRAVAALRGAQVLSYAPSGGADVLWLSPLSRLDGAKPVRGGIPVCWPWFGPHPTIGAGQSAHGIVRTVPWTIRQTRSHATGEVEAELVPAGRLPEPWPELDVALLVRLGAAALEVALATRNRGSNPVAISEALHTYFAVADVARTQIDGLGECDYVDQLDGGAVRRQLGLVTIAGETDRIYTDTDATVTIIDRGCARRIEIAKSGSQSTVVWNPWIAKSARLGDVEPEAYRRFVCVETANAERNTLVLQPGAAHVMQTTIRAAPL